MRDVDWLQGFRAAAGRGLLEQFQLLQEIFPPTYPRPQNLSYPDVPSFPRGNCFRSRSKWERGSAPPMAGNGPAVRGSSVQGFPCRYYDRRVLDEHFERGFRQRRCTARQPDLPRPPKRNGRDQKTPDGRSSDRILLLPQRRASTTARLPTRKQWPDSRMRAWHGETTPGSLTGKQN